MQAHREFFRDGEGCGIGDGASFGVEDDGVPARKHREWRQVQQSGLFTCDPLARSTQPLPERMLEAKPERGKPRLFPLNDGARMARGQAVLET